MKIYPYLFFYNLIGIPREAVYHVGVTVLVRSEGRAAPQPSRPAHNSDTGHRRTAVVVLTYQFHGNVRSHNIVGKP